MRVSHNSLFKHLWIKIGEDDVSGFSAQLAYFFLLSLFPLLIFLVTLLPYLPLSREDLLGFVRDFAPGNTMALIERNISEIMNRNGRLLSFGVIATLWSASNGLNAIVKALNRAYDVEETRSYIAARAMAIFLTIAMMIVFIVALLLPVFGKEIGLFLFSELGLSREFLAVWNTLRWGVSTLILFIVFTVLYWLAPAKKIKCVSAVPGAVFAVIGWILASSAFSYYVGNFGNFSSTYGSIGAIIVLMIWFYLSGFIIMVGGQINAYYSKRNEGC
ncbi:YihY/virulence factor BrkB family protein [Bacillus sp. V33-4]|uniref:YihY/virulence factor BrkB family protein n=1 Tax=Bacillus sp. V33-4 TaxID=2054169 RepID=UPI000C77FD6E|nr:YihY/virulence factor BrkB family protein [Bacillus sp. V33-4]PLR86947.1 ribonuclease [Bacillus sp. V33-4]